MSNKLLTFYLPRSNMKSNYDREICQIYVEENTIMEEYVPAEMEIVMIETEDVITASGIGNETGENTLTVEPNGLDVEQWSGMVR